MNRSAGEVETYGRCRQQTTMQLICNSDDLSSRLTAFNCMSLAPATAGVPTGKNGKSRQKSSGWIRARYGTGTPDSSGAERKLTMDAMVFQGFRNAFSAMFPAGGNGKTAFRRRENFKHGLNGTGHDPCSPNLPKRGGHKRFDQGWNAGAMKALRRETAHGTGG